MENSTIDFSFLRSMNEHTIVEAHPFQYINSFDIIDQTNRLLLLSTNDSLHVYKLIRKRQRWHVKLIHKIKIMKKFLQFTIINQKSIYLVLLDGQLVKFNKTLQVKQIYRSQFSGIKNAMQLGKNKDYLILLEMKNTLKFVDIHSMSIVQQMSLAMFSNSKMRALKMEKHQYFVILQAGMYVIVLKFNTFTHQLDQVHRLKQAGDIFETIPSQINRYEIFTATIFHGFSLWNLKTGQKIYDLPLQSSRNNTFIHHFIPLTKSSLLFEIASSTIVPYNMNNLRNYEVFQETDIIGPEFMSQIQPSNRTSVIKVFEYRDFLVIAYGANRKTLEFKTVKLSDIRHL